MLTLIHLLHLCIVATYLVTPIVALLLDARWARRHRRSAPSPGFVATICAGIAVGTSVSVAYAVVVGGRANTSQIALAAYFASGLLFLLKGFDSVLRAGLARLFGPRPVPAVESAAATAVVTGLSAPPPPLYRRPAPTPRAGMLSSLVRVVVLFGIGLPYILAAGLTYRPKVISREDPQTSLGVAFQPILFDSTDGVRLSGWWIPATDRRRRSGPARGASTVVICPGPGVGRSSALPLVGAFIPHGYNVLLFDFRAHGESAGQIASFGDLERRDVLGAVTWLQRERPAQAKKIFGLGIETGGAALIGAAADSSAAGQSIDAVAIYGGFNNLHDLAEQISSDNFLPPMSWLLTNVGLPIASVQAGCDLVSFSPAREIAGIWPRPVFIIHGMDDRTFPWELDRRLFESTPQPRKSRWVNDARNQHDATNQQLLSDSPTSNAVREFFDNAQPVPVI